VNNAFLFSETLIGTVEKNWSTCVHVDRPTVLEPGAYSPHCTHIHVYEVYMYLF